MSLVESPNGTTCTTSVIIDKSGVPWCLVASDTKGLQVAIKGTVDATTANVTQLLSWNHGIYYQSDSKWYKRASGAWSSTTDPRIVEAANGATLNSTTGIITDATRYVWSLVTSTAGLRVAVNGLSDTRTSNVVLLLYWDHTIYQKNSAGGWWMVKNGNWVGTTDPRIAPESPNGTQLTSTSGAISDQTGVKWTLVSSTASGLQAARDGKVDGSTANIALLLYWNHGVYQQNSAGNWWRWTNGWNSTTDPRVVSSNAVTVKLDAPTGMMVPATLFGIGCSGDMASDRFSITNNGAWQAAAKSLNMSLFRPNLGNSNVMGKIFGNQNSPDWSHLDTLLKNIPNFFDVAKGRLLVTLGGDAPSWINIGTADGQNQYARLCVQMAERFVAAGVECHWFELWNEPDGIDINTYCGLFNATSAALKVYAASRGQTYYLGGVTDTYLRAERIHALATNCRPDFLSYHQYVTGPGDGSFQPGNLSDTPTVIQRAIHNYANAANDCRAAVAGTAAANVPIFIGEWNIVFTPDSGGGTYNIDARQITNVGAVFAALAMTSAATANKDVTMGALWELYADTFYGVVRTDFSIDAQGYLFKRLATYMDGPQVSTSVGGSMNLQCLAVNNSGNFCIMLINYDQSADYSVNLGITGTAANTVVCYEISRDHLAGQTQTMAVSDLGNLLIPAMSVVIITN